MKLSEIQFGMLVKARITDHTGRVCGFGVNNCGEYLVEILTRKGDSVKSHPANLVPVEDEPANNGISPDQMRYFHRALLSGQPLGPVTRERIASIITKAIEAEEGS